LKALKPFFALALCALLYEGLVSSYASSDSATLTPQQFRNFRGLVTEAGQYTGSLEVQEYRFSGQLGGCGIVFNIVLRDWAHSYDALTYAIGSISYFAKDGEVPYIATKLSIDDFREIDGEVVMTPAKAVYSYLSTDTVTLAGKESRVVFDEIGNSLLGAYLDPNGTLLGFFSNPALTFSYNRGGADVEIDINTLEPSIGKDLPTCMIQLIAEMQKRLG